MCSKKPPLSPASTSPVERLGYKLGGKNYLDLIFPTRKRKTHFLIAEKKRKTDLGLIIYGVDHSMCEFIC
ncbi:MAG: hypothetical protein GF364_19100 [Candidatus Lokiarchaeota archaeon]|nr:hypothetical protein [Candidatus Lokiarchaeota archaeon]